VVSCSERLRHQRGDHGQGPWAGNVITNSRSACAQRGRPKRPPQLMHWIRLRREGTERQAGQATKRTPSWRNTAGVSVGTTQTAGMPCCTNAVAVARDSVEALITSPLAAASRMVAWLAVSIGKWVNDQAARR
jgi:hypothetical protein